MAPITVEELLARARARLQRVGPAEAAEACGARLVDTPRRTTAGARA